MNSLSKLKIAFVTLSLVLIVGVFMLLSSSPQRSKSVTANLTSGVNVGTHAESGTFLTLSGKDANVANYFEKGPTLIWFIVTGCASCSVSLPIASQYLNTFESRHVHVLVLDLYGDLSYSKQGEIQLGEFGSQVSSKVTSKAWTWGLASESLSYAYDPTSIPDQYFLVEKGGDIYYQNNDLASSIQSLLQKISALKDA